MGGFSYDGPVAAGDRRLILVVDDEVDNCRLISRLFRRDYDVLEAYDGHEALAVAREHKPAVVITDQRMPGISGVELLSALREEQPDVIRVLMTGYAEYDALVHAVNAAAVHQYFEKPFRPASVARMVDTLVEKRELERERERLLARLRESEAELQRQVAERTGDLRRALGQLEDANRQLREMVVRDGLTGVHNHRYLIEYMEIELARSRRYEREFGVLFIDVDDFKQVNDSHGHHLGDEVLRRIAGHLQPTDARMRQSDFAARYGGEEFVVVLPETGLEGACIKAERIRAAIETESWAPLSSLSVSIGVAAFPRHGANVDQLLSVADAALYEAKRAGKNRVVCADTKLAVHA